MPSPRKVRKSNRAVTKRSGPTLWVRSVSSFSRLPALATAATAAVRAIGLGTRFVDVQRTAIQFAAVDRGDRLLGLAVVGHFHKPKASGLSGVTIGTDVDTVYGAVGFKKGADGCFRYPKTEVAYKYVLHVYLSLVAAANWWVDGSGTLGGSARNQRVLQQQYSKTY